MQKGRGGMGIHKHGISGHSKKSPKFRHWMKREAEKEEARRRPREELRHTTVQEAIREYPKR